MVDTIDLLSWSSMTAAVNETKDANNFLKNRMFGRTEAKSTETLELSVYVGDREIAPLVKKNGSALMVEGYDEKFQTVEAPNIRIKRPLTPSEQMFKRRPSTVIFPTTSQQISAMEANIARDLSKMEQLILNTEEWLAAQAIRGQIVYQVADEEVFQITYPRSATHNATSVQAGTWLGANPTVTADEIHDNFLGMRRLINEGVGLEPEIAVFNSSVTRAFLQAPGLLPQLDARNYSAGSVTRESSFTDQGALFLGRISNTELWEYNRSVLVDGTSEKLIRDNYIEFLSPQPAAENVMYYGAVADWKALRGRRFIGRRFSKSWEEDDPSIFMSLVAARPLPVPRRPDAHASLLVS